jgi:hypothetical protein
MKSSFVVLGLAASMAGMLLSGCGKSPDQKIDTANARVVDATQQLKEARDSYRANWESFKRDADLAIEANGKAIDSLKAKISKAGKIGKAEFSKDLAVLEQKNTDLKKKLTEYSDQGETAWETFRTDVKHDLESIGDSMRDLYKKIG